MTDRYGHPRQSIFAPGRRHASATASVAFSTSQHPAMAPPTAPTKQSRKQRLLNQLVPRRQRDADGDTVVVDELSDEDSNDDSSLHGDLRREESIVVRDSNGEYKLEEPPRLDVDDTDDIVLDMRHENEKERQRLAEAVKQHRQHNSVPVQPEEIVEAVKASLRAKVAALAEDRWMYEKEEEPRPC